jgi:hypothetical protein
VAPPLQDLKIKDQRGEKSRTTESDGPGAVPHLGISKDEVNISSLGFYGTQVPTLRRGGPLLPTCPRRSSRLKKSPFASLMSTVCNEIRASFDLHGSQRLGQDPALSAFEHLSLTYSSALCSSRSVRTVQSRECHAAAPQHRCTCV